MRNKNQTPQQVKSLALTMAEMRDTENMLVGNVAARTAKLRALRLARDGIDVAATPAKPVRTVPKR